MKYITVLDNDPFVACSLKSLVETSFGSGCLLTTATPLEFIYAVFSKMNMDYAFISYHSTDCRVLFAIQAFISSRPYSCLIVMLEDVNTPTLKLMLCMGVRFIITRREKLISIQHLMHKSIKQDDYYISPLIQALIDESPPPSSWNKMTPSNIALFTPTEKNVIIELLNGSPPRAVAKKLSISVKTVSVHKRNALKKMSVKNLNAFFSIIPRQSSDTNANIR
ncbi:LuxR C-terminal-related transcriptional regulator [Serratia rubidaea]|nr:LuxR C-terminal-related transcriptional regulator [Serratia rubidaea]